MSEQNPAASTPPSALIFYQFLGAHSLLIGLFPFYLPVWMWKMGFDLADICAFVAISGLSFVFSLRIWEYLASRVPAATLFGLSFVFELVLVVVAACEQTISANTLLIALAVINGIYNCFFWTTQRSLFLQRVTPADSGRQYGNLQIVVSVFLKIGILIGGLLLENIGMLAILAVSALLSLVLAVWFYRTERTPLIPAQTETSFNQILKFRDDYGSRRVFYLDGLFLFFESHFWTLSLFMISKENFSRFGLTVIALAIGFALLFFILKNSIDRFAGGRAFTWAVGAYAFGWLIRPILGVDMSLTLAAIFLIVATFCTSFFRLVFNKRFFDIAAASSGQRYLVIKSYYTQFSVACIFGLMAMLSSLPKDQQTTLSAFYLLAAVCSFVYLGYKNPQQESD